MDISYLFMLPFLEFLDKTVGSYGWAILGLTLAVRILVWPLVSASTKSMQAMSKLQPHLKAMQEKYKDQPEELQKRMAEFYMKNKVNPLSGCLPMLVQLPILFALFGTFSGPPFQDKAIPVKIKLVAPDKAAKTTVTINPTSGADSAYISKEGKLCKFVVHPGDSTVVLGKSQEGQPTSDGFSTLDFSVSASQGEAPSDFKPAWKIAMDPNGASISPEGIASFPIAGNIVIGAVVPTSLKANEEVKKEDTKVIPVTVRVLEKPKEGFPLPGGSSEDAIKEKKEKSETTVEGTIDGRKVVYAVEPGDMTIVAGKTAKFSVKVIEGSDQDKALQSIGSWKIVEDANGASIDDTGKAIFRHDGEVVVNAMIPGEAKNEPFLFINSIGKVAKGMDLLKPENFDVLSLILLFGITMYLSQKFMTTAPADPESEQAQVQKQTQQIMPFTVTAMFFFMPLPAGVYLYMVFSNVVQTLQTWLIMQSPTPDIPPLDGDDSPGSGPKVNKDGVIDIVPNDKKSKKSGNKGSEGKSNLIESSSNDKKEKKEKNPKGASGDGKSEVIDVSPNDKKTQEPGESVKINGYIKENEGKNK